MALPMSARAKSARQGRPAGLKRALSAGLISLAVSASAAEYRSVASAAVLYDAPSRQAAKLFVAPRGMPLEVVSSAGLWVKVRDVSGDFAWIERTSLGDRRFLVAATLATIRQQPQDSSDELIQVERGVLLELAEPVGPQANAQWVKVRHRDGALGWVRANEVWGW
jgi:SH3-like domain-containing protein